jgi:hypothetical protein
METSSKRHRWYQFSLRTLFVLTAVVAIVSAIAPAAYERYQRYQKRQLLIRCIEHGPGCITSLSDEEEERLLA